jgi:predicted O-linked N-acetylglucosamine transferase (SPINDLY family)
MTEPAPKALLAEALHAHRGGRLEEAIPLYRLLLRETPADPDLRHLLALALHRDRPGAAGAELRRALALAPSTALYLHNAARLAAESGRIADAVSCYRRLLALAEHVDRRAELGRLLHHAGRAAEAVAVFRGLVRLSPDRPEAHGLLGAALAEAGDDGGAAAQLRRVLALAPAAAEAWHTLGLIHGRDPVTSDEAIHAAGRAVLLSPAATAPHLTRAFAFFQQGRIREAFAARRAALALAPSDAEAHYAFLSFLHLDPDLTPEDQLAWRRRVHRRFSDPLTRAAAPHANDRDPDRRLKLGYLDDRMLCRSTHSTNLLPTIEAHDLKQVELFFYTNLPEAMADDMTARYRAKASVFRFTAGLSDEALAARLREDAIDILVDAASHLTGARARVCAMKPAPIQVTMMQVGSSGMAAMDYAVADPVLLPEGEPGFFSERVIRLPMGFLFEPVADLTPPLRPVARQGPPTFGSLNQLAKIGPAVLALWARVLERVPGSRLLIKSGGLASPAVRRRIGAFFEDRGIARERLDLRAWTRGYAGHLDTFAEIDVALDCFPYPGMTTSLEAILMGVPVVTLAGDRFAGRIGEAILKVIGHPEWVARDEEAYIAIAQGLALDREGRAGLRRDLRQALLASPLANPRRFTSGLEAALRAAWRGWCRDRQAGA